MWYVLRKKIYAVDVMFIVNFRTNNYGNVIFENGNGSSGFDKILIIKKYCRENLLRLLIVI